MSIAKHDALGPQDEATSYTVDSKSHLQISDNEYDDAEKNYQPKTLRFWFIIAGLYMSLFLVALV
jgi:hypothetical protein